VRKRLILIYVEGCSFCKRELYGAAEQLAHEIGYEFSKRKPTMQELQTRRWSAGFPAFVLEWGPHQLIMVGNKVVPTLARYTDVLREANLTPAELAQHIQT